MAGAQLELSAEDVDRNDDLSVGRPQPPISDL